MIFYDRPSTVRAFPSPGRCAPPALFTRWTLALAATLFGPATVTAPAHASTPAFPLICDITGYAPTGGITARVSGDALLVEWPGAEDELLRLGLRIVDGRPTIAQLAIRGEGESWTTIATDARIEFKITEGRDGPSLGALRSLGFSRQRCDDDADQARRAIAHRRSSKHPRFISRLAVRVRREEPTPLAPARDGAYETLGVSTT